jgi:hypothetical protein
MKSDQSSKGREHVTETPDVSHIKNVDVTHEVSDVDVRGVMKFVIGLTVMTVIVYLLMLLMFNVLTKREESEEPARSPMAMTDKERLPPEPRLQSARGFGEKLEGETGMTEPHASPTPKDPLWEINVLRDHWNSVLANGEKDPSGRLSVLPIDQAKAALLKNGGPPARSKTISEEGPGWRVEDYAVDMPTAASSGRMTEKRKQ